MFQIKRLEELKSGDIVLVVSEDAHGSYHPADLFHWQPAVEVVSFAKLDSGVRHDGPCWYAEFDSREIPIHEEQDGTFADGEFGPCEIWLLHRGGPHNAVGPDVQ